MMKTALNINDLIGRKVKTGSPGYENLETIQSVEDVSDWLDGERFLVEFESGCFTNISKPNLNVLLEKGEVAYTRWFTSSKDRAAETMSLV
jgi:hypothetical protein